MSSLGAREKELQAGRWRMMSWSRFIIFRGRTSRSKDWTGGALQGSEEDWEGSQPGFFLEACRCLSTNLRKSPQVRV